MSSLFVNERKRPQPEVIELDSRGTFGMISTVVKDGKIDSYQLRRGFGYSVADERIRFNDNELDDLIVRLTEVRDRARHIAHEFETKQKES